MLLEIQAACAGHANIEDEATRPLRKIGVQAVPASIQNSVRRFLPTAKFLKRGSNLLIIVHDQDERVVCIVSSHVHGRAG